MPTKLSNAPVYYALAQAQFSPVPAMHKYVDEIQDRLRRLGFTLFEPQQFTQLQIQGEIGGVMGEPQLTHTMAWLMTKADRSAGFILNANSISFHTTHYETSEEFLPTLLTGLQAVHEVASLAHISRLGIRYLDAVLPKENEQVEDYLAPGLKGIDFDAPRAREMTESVFDTQCEPLVIGGNLVSRVYKVYGQVGFPGDLLPQGLELMPKFVTEAQHHAVIDTDHSVTGQIPIDFALLDSQLRNLHSAVKRLFAATVTDYANSVWA